MNANLQSACFNVLPFWTAGAVKKRIIGIEITGEKQSAFVHEWCYKLLSMTMRLFARVGTPFVCFTTKVHMEGMAQIP
jgi:hypothetical protein